MKLRKDESAVITSLALWLAYAVAAPAQTCMTEELLMDTKPKPAAIKPVAVPAKNSVKTTGSGIAVLDGDQSSRPRDPSHERGKNNRRKIAGRN